MVRTRLECAAQKAFDRRFLAFVVRRLVLGLVLALMICSRAHANGADCLPAAGFPPPEYGQPANIEVLKTEFLSYECSGVYEQQIRGVIDDAISYVQEQAKRGGHLAIVLDIDETSLSNWEEMKVNNFNRIDDGPCELGEPDAENWRVPVPKKPCGFTAWILLAQARPLDTIRLFKVANENKVAVFFITGRKDDQQHTVRDATVANLHKAGYSTWTDLMLEPAGFTGKIQEFKTQKRTEIEEDMHYKIIANVGDQYSDLRGGHSERVFKLPNPFYFVP